ncbi:hypothetical protein EPO56_02120 [Patescibacteria group bacterium]|nr:MAG: hypothetical protein EPO56_02120 [Patescibacteria group bacterium]
MSQNHKVNDVGGVRKVPAANGILYELAVSGTRVLFFDNGSRFRPIGGTGGMPKLGKPSRRQAWERAQDARGHH